MPGIRRAGGRAEQTVKQLPTLSYQQRGEQADLRYDDAESRGATLGRPDDRRGTSKQLN